MKDSHTVFNFIPLAGVLGAFILKEPHILHGRKVNIPSKSVLKTLGMFTKGSLFLIRGTIVRFNFVAAGGVNARLALYDDAHDAPYFLLAATPTFLCNNGTTEIPMLDTPLEPGSVISLENKFVCATLKRLSKLCNSR